MQGSPFSRTANKHDASSTLKKNTAVIAKP